VHKICDITFRTLVEAHDSRKHDKAYNKLLEQVNMTSSGVELLPYIANKGEEEQKKLVIKNYRNLLIPKVIFALYPKLNYDDYKVLKKDTVFLSKNTQVCEKCFLDLTKYCSFSGANTENVLRVLKSKIPDNLYIKKAGNNYGENFGNNSNYNINNATNGFGRSFGNNVNNNFYNGANLNKGKVRSKTPVFGYANNYGINGNLMNMRNTKTNMNSTIGNLGSYSGFNNNNNNNDNRKNEYKPDFSSKIKFIMQPKKDFQQNSERLGNKKEKEGLNLNAIGHNNSNLNSNFTSNKQQISQASSATNVNHINNNENNNNFFLNNNSNVNNLNMQIGGYEYNNSKNNSMNMEQNNNKIIGNISNEANKITQINKNSLLNKNSDSKVSLNLSHNNKCNDRNNNNLNKSDLSSCTNKQKIKQRNDFEESKIHDNHNHNDFNDNESEDEEEEIDNKVKCEILEVERKIREKNFSKDLIKQEAQVNSIREKELQHDSESDDEEDGHDNQSENDQDMQVMVEEARIGEEIKIKKFEEEKN
jgi:hypothetical protein